MATVLDTSDPGLLLRSVLWRRLDEPSLEHCRLRAFADCYAIDGRIVTVLDGRPAETHYEVVCDSRWVTRYAHVALIHGTVTRQLQLRRDDDNQWWRGEDRLIEFDGLMDVDLSLSPSTNTLPMRRLTLDIGESTLSDAVWVRFPELTVERLPQRYTRLDTQRYRYESHGGSFAADIVVDELGLVIRYGDIWERLAP